MRRRRERKVELSPEEDRAWVFSFCFYKCLGRTDLEADHLASRDLRLEFPHLEPFDGYEP